MNDTAYDLKSAGRMLAVMFLVGVATFVILTVAHNLLSPAIARTGFVDSAR